MDFFQGKVVVVTGSSQGIGKELASQLLGRGACVVINARNAERLETVKAQFENYGENVLAVAGDVGIPDDCNALIEAAVGHYGKLDILINNAGIGIQFPFETIEPHVIRMVTDTNFLGSMYCTRFALPYLKKTKGSVMFMGSIAGIHGIPNSNVYAATKMALTGFAESLRLETIHTGVHVGLAYLGFTRNDPQKQFVQPDGSLVTCPDRNPRMVASVEKVADLVLQMIEKREHKRVFGHLGRLLMTLNRLSPDLVSWILSRNLHRFDL